MNWIDGSIFFTGLFLFYKNVSLIVDFVLKHLIFFCFSVDEDGPSQWGCLWAWRCTTLPALLVHMVINVARQKAPETKRDRMGSLVGALAWKSLTVPKKRREEKGREEKRRTEKNMWGRGSWVKRGTEQCEWVLSSVGGSLLFCVRRKGLFPAGSHAPCFVTQAPSVSIHRWNTGRVWRRLFGSSHTAAVAKLLLHEQWLQWNTIIKLSS